VPCKLQVVLGCADSYSILFLQLAISNHQSAILWARPKILDVQIHAGESLVRIELRAECNVVASAGGEFSDALSHAEGHGADRASVLANGERKMPFAAANLLGRGG
jgi:hypothetical protein